MSSPRVAVVTGAAGGIGRAFAARLARDGAHVALLDRADASAAAAEIAEAGGHALAVACDVTDEASVAGAAATVARELGPATVLANVAGAGVRAPFEQVTFADWRRTVAVNLDGPFLTCAAFAPAMRSAGHGRILNVASSMIATSVSGFVPYLASKMGLVGLTRALANDLGEHGVTANAIAPGLTRTARAVATVQDERMFELAAAGQAIKRTIEVDDLLGAMAFLVSDEAAMITGQTLMVNGGFSRL